MWYWVLLLVLFVVNIAVTSMVNSRFKKYSTKLASSRVTGAQAAQLILRSKGITDVKIRQIPGHLSDNYNPITKTLSLSSDVCNKSSISAVCVAAHETGHAIQHAEHYKLLGLRKILVPIANFSSSLSYIFMVLGILFQASNLIMIGALVFSAIVAFNLITLPVEIDASRRALACVRENGLLNEQEAKDGKKVLTAAGLTYFLALMSSILQLVRLLSIANNQRNN